MTIFEEKGEPKRGVEPASFRLPAERLDHQAKPAQSQGPVLEEEDHEIFKARILVGRDHSSVQWRN